MTVLNFKGGSKGDYPYAGVTPDENSYYGTTQYGGKYSDGIVFSVWDGEETVLWNFNHADGLQPLGNVILDSAGDVFGTTYQGGSSGAGVVFEVTPPQVKTKAALSSFPNPSAYGQPVGFVATISPTPPNGEAVSFTRGKGVIGTALLNAGSATLTTSSLAVGTNVIKAVYAGDIYLLGSSKTTNQAVNKATTTTAIASSLNPSSQGQSVTFTATVTPQYGSTPQYGGGTPKGTVIFYDETTELGRKSVRGGAAQLATTKLTSGTHTITATYGGSTNFDSSSASLTQTVN
ncbi:MAG: Ig-like domain-containing protein [Terriglobales bacterium]